MREPAITDKIVKALNGVEECRAKKKHSGKFGGGDPDVSGCFRGHAFFIEVKKLEGELTLLQADQLEKWRKAGALTFVGIYDTSAKLFMLIELDESESWDQFANKEGVHELWDESAERRLPLRDYPFETLLDERTFNAE